MKHFSFLFKFFEIAILKLKINFERKITEKFMKSFYVFNQKSRKLCRFPGKLKRNK